MTSFDLAGPSLAGRIDAIVIGTSAGGVEALASLLPALPAELAASVFVVVHIPRERPSLLVDIFVKRVAVAVKEAEDKETVAPGTVYFSPPDYHLQIDKERDGTLQLSLSADELVNYSRPSIDVLFETAADAYGPRLLGIVLTGGNHDGAAGLAAVHRAGGVTVVQDPSTASTSAMPLAALELTSPNYVLPLDQIAILLRSLMPLSPRGVPSSASTGNGA